jgi:hypothetical protein
MLLSAIATAAGALGLFLLAAPSDTLNSKEEAP